MEVLQRYRKNPIIKPSERIKWMGKATFNCGVVKEGKKAHMLFRAVAEYEQYISVIGHAESEDFVNFEIDEKPAIVPEHQWERFGCEDPRITKIGNKFYITYVALQSSAKKPATRATALAITKDFEKFEKIGYITPKTSNNKDVVLFPKKFANNFAILHRPHNWNSYETQRKNGKFYTLLADENIELEWEFDEPKKIPKKPSIWFAFSKDLKNWHNVALVLEPTLEWENEKVGAGAPPIKTKEGWLLLYHGVGKEKGKRRYCAGAALLDKKEPWQLIAKLNEPILEPKEWYETKGDVANVVFPTGAFVHKKKLYVYYGAADKYCCLATCELRELLEKFENL